jgi:hypothetical protein
MLRIVSAAYFAGAASIAIAAGLMHGPGNAAVAFGVFCLLFAAIAFFRSTY